MLQAFEKIVLVLNHQQEELYFFFFNLWILESLFYDLVFSTSWVVTKNQTYEDFS